MKALFVANLESKETEGIFKKVCAESDAVGKAVGSCELVTRSGKKAVIKSFNCMERTLSDEDFLTYIRNRFEKKDVQLAYIRHMIPSPEFIKALKVAKRNRIKVYYEIPTYPYFGEQFNTSIRKHRAIVKITLDILFWPLIYKYIDKLVVIKSNSTVKMFSKMAEITNGVQTSNIKSKDYSKFTDNKVFRMVAVGTLYPYHGYDRILKGLRQCNEIVDDSIIEFHVVGQSQTIDDLHQMADSMGLKHTIFHGIKTTEELNDLYDSFDVGLGCLALHRRNADIDTTLKTIEYYCRGVPVVTSGKVPFSQKEYTFVVPDDESPIDIDSIFDYYKALDKDKLQNLSEIAKCQFDWNNIMKRLLA